MDWAEGFYSTTGRWWGAAESRITQRDHGRVALIRAFCRTDAVTMLELGCGYGSTAATAARDGFRVTGVDNGGRAVIDVANPLVWAGWAGDTSHRAARPADGYQPGQRRAY